MWIDCRATWNCFEHGYRCKVVEKKVEGILKVWI